MLTIKYKEFLYMEFYADETALQKTVLQMFYDAE